MANKTKEIIWDYNSALGEKTEKALITELKSKVKSFCDYRKKLPTLTIKGMKDLLIAKEELLVVSSKIQGYYALRFFDNITNSEVLAKMTKFSQLSTDLSNETIFFSLWFMHLDNKKARQFLDAPELSEYKYFLEEIRKDKPYTKSEEVEKIISLKSITGAEAHNQVYELLTANFKFDFNKRKNLTQEEVAKNFYSKNPELREESYRVVLGKYQENKVILNEIYKNIVLDWSTEGLKIRGHKTPISIRNFANDIDDKIIETLLGVIRKNAKVFQEYFKLKYALNKKKGENYPFSRFHLYAPYANDNEAKYDFEKSKKIMLELFSSFDARFYEAAVEIIEKKNVHAYPKLNKKTGAYCFGLHNRETPFILLNHVGTLRDLFIMMHEFGHGVHYTLAKKQNNLVYDSSLPMSETASIFSEMMLATDLLKKSRNDEEKRSILIKLLDDQFASIIRQAYFVMFEIFAHNSIDRGLTEEELDKEYHQLLKEQFGEMEVPELFDQEWHYIPHIHQSPFYCYAYAWGNLLVLALFAMYREEGEMFKEKYISLLEAGGSKSPVELLKSLGIDPAKEEFWGKGFTIIKDEIKELRKLNKS
jgi:oligoendopeptidase F